MERDVFKQMLKEKGLKITGQRMLVLETMAAHPGEHLTAEEIFDFARKRAPQIGLATVYRALQMLVQLGVVDRIRLGDGFARYELSRELGREKHHHHHAICLGCRSVLSLEEDLLDSLEQSLAERMGFRVTDHEVKLYGYCRACRAKEEERKDRMKQEELEGSD